MFTMFLLQASLNGIGQTIMMTQKKKKKKISTKEQRLTHGL